MSQTHASCLPDVSSSNSNILFSILCIDLCINMDESATSRLWMILSASVLFMLLMPQ